MASDGMVAVGALRQLVRSPQIGELAYEAIRNLLIDGTLDPDARVVEAALTIQLGTSRTPVREALARLANEGFLVSGRHGYRVPVVTAEDIRNMSQLRALLEPEAARQAASDLADTGIAEMRTALAAAMQGHAADDAGAVVAANTAYRRSWMKRVNNPLLLGALTKVMSSLQLIRRRTMADQVLRAHILEMQQGLLKHIEQRDAAGAAAWQFDHIWTLNSLMLERLYAGEPQPSSIEFKP